MVFQPQRRLRLVQQFKPAMAPQKFSLGAGRGYCLHLAQHSPGYHQRRLDLVTGAEADLAAVRTSSRSGPDRERPLEGALGPAPTSPDRRLWRGRSTPDGLGHQRLVRSKLFVCQRRGFLVSLARRCGRRYAEARKAGCNSNDSCLCCTFIAEPDRLWRTFPFGCCPRLAYLWARLCNYLSAYSREANAALVVLPITMAPITLSPATSRDGLLPVQLGEKNSSADILLSGHSASRLDPIFFGRRGSTGGLGGL
jgi:hypothetical protein